MSDYIEEKIKKIKEIADLQSEIQKTKELLSAGKMDELSAHLQELNSKYLLETTVYNMAHPVPPKSTMENAQNCIDFLSMLLAGKVAESGIKK